MAVAASNLIVLRGVVTAACPGANGGCGGVCVKNSTATTENGVCVVMSSAASVSNMNAALSFGCTITKALMVNTTEILSAASGVLHDPISSLYEPEVNWTSTASLTNMLAAGA